MIKILDGQKVAQSILEKVNRNLIKLRSKGIQLSLAVISIEGDEASTAYIHQKEKLASRLGVIFHLYEMLPLVSEAQIVKLIKKLNNSDSVSGIIVQLPLPQNLNRRKILDQIKVEKDIDGLNPKNRAKSATALAILRILDFYGIELKGKKIGILGNGYLVGQPLTQILKKKGLKFEIWDEKMKDLAQKSKKADILILGTGQANLVGEEMVKDRVVVIDCGAPYAELNDKVKEKLAAYSPVPGGVGPVTLAILFENLVKGKS